MKKRILVIGSLNMDMVIEMRRMPSIGETVMGDNLAYVPGGKGANQAYAAGKLGGQVTMLGCVGADSMGDSLLESLSGAGVHTEYIGRSRTQPTGTAVIYVDQEGDNSIVVVPGANGVCDRAYLEQHDLLIQESDYVLFQLEIPHDAVAYGIHKAKEYGKTVILNPAPAPDYLPDDLWQDIDYLTPNETELLKMTGQNVFSMENVLAGARQLLAKGIKNVLITLGDKGVLLVNHNTESLFPARKVQAVDTTAAGDCFNGALAAGIAEGMDLEEAVTFANRASSIAVTRKGAQTSIPQREEVERSENSVAV